VSQRTVQEWIRSGTLTAVRYGRLLRIRPADLATFGEVLPRRSPLHIPRISATQSTGMLPRNPWECCHPVHGNVAIQSTA
jgi:excisionase family DNA binding protein